MAPSPKLERAKSMSSIPYPVPELIRTSEEIFSANWVPELAIFLVKAAEWTVFFLMGYFGFGYAWVLLLATLYVVRHRDTKSSLTDVAMARLSSAAGSEPEVLGRSLGQFPSWVAFPDFDRAEFVNDLIRQLWPSVGGYATTFVLEFIEPEIRRILEHLKLETVSGFQFKKVDLGTIPARVGGIKVYNRNVDRGEIVMDVEVLFSGDARVLVTLQGVQAEIHKINFRGTARVTLKPVLRTFPFVGGMDVCFLNKPQLDYSLGGIGTFGEIPGAKSIIKTIIEEQIRTRFVWPNRLRLFLPIDQVKRLSDKEYLLMKPSGLLEVRVLEARDLMRMDKGLTGSGKSDPYAKITIGTKVVSFRDRYVAKTINPKFDYSTQFEIEDHFGQSVRVDLYDWDSSTSDDFLGFKALDLDVVVRQGEFDEWLALEGVPRGEVHLSATWEEVVPVEDEDEAGFDTFILSVFVDSCKNLNGGSSKRPPSPKCVLTHTQGDVKSTQVRPKTRDPVFEEAFTFSGSKNLDTDNLTVEVVDSKNSDYRLGWVKIPMLFLKKSHKREFFTNEWKLEGGSSESASVSLSAKLYGTYL